MSPPIVSLSLVNVSNAGAPAAGEHRRAHCILAADLRASLNLEVGDQIRVGFPFPFAGCAAGNTAIFTIHHDGAAGSGLQIFANTSADELADDGQDGGVYKLYGLGGQPGLPADLATIWNVAPSETRTDGVVLAGDSHFIEPSADLTSKYFRELVTIGDADHRVILLVPHGGAIDQHTSLQIPPFRGALTTASATVWECQGAWAAGQTAARWHITATDLQERSFPGLWRIVHEGVPYQPGVHFQYAVALHGFRWDTDSKKKGIIIGGRASRADKHAVMNAVRDAILNDAALGQPEVDLVAFYIANTAGIVDDAYPALDQAWESGFDFASIAGLSKDNLVNRLSPNADPILHDHRGGIQIEQSMAVRASATLRAAVARGIGAAVEGLVNNFADAPGPDARS
jgi:phage replication-related protein YjqB (UPF0714/DUF867 family)